MDNRQILILLKIGGIDVSQKCIDSVSVDRNFSDVGDKFTITLVDSPQTSILYDLELYMASGYRSITLKYGDISKDHLVGYTGTIWDYTNTFVGNIKKLTVTGIMNRYTNNQSGAANYTYNIDWNSYFNKRKDEDKNFGAIDTLLVRGRLNSEFNALVNSLTKADRYGRSSDILNPEFAEAINTNAKTLTLKGPGGEVQLPIPESFCPPLINDQIPEDLTSYDASLYKEYDRIINDTVIDETPNRYWGPLTVSATTVNPRSVAGVSLFSNPSPTLYFKADANLNKDGQGRVIIDDVAIRNLCGIEYGKILGNPYLAGTMLSTSYWREDLSWSSDWADNTNSYYGYIKSKTDYVKYTGVNPESWVIYNYRIVDYKDTQAKIKDKQVAVYLNYKIPGQETWIFTRPFVAVDSTISTIIKRESLYQEVSNYVLSDPILGGVDNSGNAYFKDAMGRIRAFTFTDTGSGERKLFVQANPRAVNGEYGAACIVSSGIGVDISSIVKKLCVLEGWKYKDEYIAQTELVANSDAFRMDNQAAMDFIINNLVPRAITAVGEYTLLNGNKKLITTSQAGFYPFFDDDGYFHFHPLTKEAIKKLDIPNLGYNMPNSPVISFQINTKGTAFYTFNNIEYKPMNLVTGNLTTEDMTVSAISDAQAQLIASTRGHNDTFDDWLGLRYDDVESLRTKGMTENELYEASIRKAPSALVNSPSTLLIGTTYENTSDIATKLSGAKEKIEKTVIKATMSLWGNVEIAPARNIEILNMIKGGVDNANYPQTHSSSGIYLILSMQDKIDSGGFIQNLNLVRYTNEISKSINSCNIDYTQGASYVTEIIRDDSTLTDRIADAILPVLESELNATSNNSLQGERQY